LNNFFKNTFRDYFAVDVIHREIAGEKIGGQLKNLVERKLREFALMRE
jgi:hypothetical protein